MSLSIFDIIRTNMNIIHEKAALAQTHRQMGKLTEADELRLQAAALSLANAADILEGDDTQQPITNELATLKAYVAELESKL